MPKRSSKPDLNQLAASIVSRSTAEKPSVIINTVELERPTKNLAAVELGRLGGLKGGRIRAQNLSAARRKTIAKKAAKARWKKEKRKG
jgi:hypothetical protein